MNWQVPDSELAPQRPINPSRGIGVIGCGEIVNIAHLPAYRAANLNVAACYDINLRTAEDTAGKFGIPIICQSLDELLELSQVEVVDIAIHMDGRMETFQRCAEAKKHILMQKPVAHTFAVANEFVRIAQMHSVKYQVNQQARWAGTHTLVRRWCSMGAIGRLNFLRLEMRGWQDDPKTWYVSTPDFTLVDHGVHYFDLLRFLSGARPIRVCAMQASVPSQVSMAPMVYACVIEFEGGLLAEHCFNNKVETDAPWGLNIVLDGVEGTIQCDFETVRLSRKDGTSVEQTPTSKWFPDAFLGPMANLLDSIECDDEPVCSGSENLGTMLLVEAALRSAERGTFLDIAR